MQKEGKNKLKTGVREVNIGSIAGGGNISFFEGRGKKRFSDQCI
jgi:hypothetical protein